jgi:RNA polymerase sigma factor (sigma-70 family)
VDQWHVRLSEGDIDSAWDVFIETYRPLILATIRHALSNRHEIMEAFAHVCGALSANALDRLASYYRQTTHTAKFSTWLVVVVRNETIDWARKHTTQPHVALSDELADESPLADQLVEASELKERLRGALEILDPDDRLAVQLYVVDGLAAAEVAFIIGWPNPKTVYNRVYRALSALRARLEQEGIAPGV